MEWFEFGLRYTHIIFGFAGLAAFWIPILTRKGGRQHVKYGNLFLKCAYIVLGSAEISVIYRLGKFILAGKGPAEAPMQFSFLLFLGYLALVTFIMIRHAILVLRYKKNPELLQSTGNRIMAVLAILASVLLVVYTFTFAPPNKIILFVLSPLGISTGYGILKYLNSTISPKSWVYEHIGGMLGGGIAFHTAFAVFGGARIFNLGLEGGLAVLPWILPALIGIPASIIWVNIYNKKYAKFGIKKDRQLMGGLDQSLPSVSK